MYGNDDEKHMEIALCQFRTVVNDVRANLDTVTGFVEGTDADIYVFPELFLTGYFFDRGAVSALLDDALERVRGLSQDLDVAIVMGAPLLTDDGMYNCAYAFVSGEEHVYRKIHLPNFEPFSERDTFIPGSEPMTFTHRGFVFGLSICYDVFFPELLKHHSLRGGADVNIAISASPMRSRTAFERVLPARAVENTTYMAFVNNIGPIGPLEFFGGSRLLAPNGDPLVQLEGDSSAVLELDRDVIETARKMRPVLRDSVL